MSKEILQQALDALNHIYASTPPYKENGGCTFLDKTVEISNAAIAALEVAIAQPVQPAIPDGWKLVPLEPTDRMAAAAIGASLKDSVAINGLLQYKAMLAAAPIAPAMEQPVQPASVVLAFPHSADFSETTCPACDSKFYVEREAVQPLQPAGRMLAVAVVIEELDHDGNGFCAKVRWPHNPVPAREELFWEHAI